MNDDDWKLMRHGGRSSAYVQQQRNEGVIMDNIAIAERPDRNTELINRQIAALVQGLREQNMRISAVVEYLVLGPAPSAPDPVDKPQLKQTDPILEVIGRRLEEMDQELKALSAQIEVLERV